MGEELKKFSLTEPYSIINLEYDSKVIQGGAGLMIVLTEMPRHGASQRVLRRDVVAAMRRTHPQFACAILRYLHRREQLVSGRFGLR